MGQLPADPDGPTWFSLKARVHYDSGCRARVTTARHPFGDAGHRLLRTQCERETEANRRAVALIRHYTEVWAKNPRSEPLGAAEDLVEHFGDRYERVEFMAAGGRGFAFRGVLRNGGGHEVVKGQIPWSHVEILRTEREVAALAECAGAFREGRAESARALPATVGGRPAFVGFPHDELGHWSPCVDVVRRPEGAPLAAVVPLTRTARALGFEGGEAVHAAVFVMTLAPGFGADEVLRRVYGLLRERPGDLELARAAARMLARAAALVEKVVVGLALAALTHNDVKLDNLFLQFQAGGDGMPVDAVAIDMGAARCVRAGWAPAALEGWEIDDGPPRAFSLGVDLVEAGAFVEENGFKFFQSSRALVANLSAQSAVHASRAGLEPRGVLVEARRAVWLPHVRLQS